MRKRHPCVPPAAPAHVRGIAWLIASGTLGPQDTYHSSTVHNGFLGSAQTLVIIGVLAKRVRELVSVFPSRPRRIQTRAPRVSPARSPNCCSFGADGADGDGGDGDGRHMFWTVTHVFFGRFARRCDLQRRRRLRRRRRRSTHVLDDDICFWSILIGRRNAASRLNMATTALSACAALFAPTVMGLVVEGARPAVPQEFNPSLYENAPNSARGVSGEKMRRR